jgi:predicted phosphodiesterase
VRLAALYDIHGNLPALDAVLDAIARLGVDRVVIGGDVVPGPMPSECLHRISTLAVPVDAIHGNGEIAVLNARAGRDPGRLPESAREAVRWVADELDAVTELSLASWPLTSRLAVSALGDVLFCHATPRDAFEIFTAHTPDAVLRPIFDAANAAVVVCGHTHIQFDRTIGRTRVVNAGSVGMPFGAPGADWLLIDDGTISLRHTAYDLEAAAARIRGTRYPSAMEFAERDVLAPRSADEMAALFAKAEIR